MPVGGITQKVEAAIEAGLKQVILPEANLADVVLPNGKTKIKIIPVKKFEDIFSFVFTSKKHLR